MDSHEMNQPPREEPPVEEAPLFVPDPNGSPQPVSGAEKSGFSAGAFGCALVAGGVTSFLLLGSMCTRTSGATRSAQLRWQDRQAQIEQAFQAEQRGTEDEANPDQAEAE